MVTKCVKRVFTPVCAVCNIAEWFEYEDNWPCTETYSQKRQLLRKASLRLKMKKEKACVRYVIANTRAGQVRTSALHDDIIC